MRKAERAKFIIAFLSPAVLLYSIFVLVPLLQSFSYSAFQWKGLSQNRKFVGFGNYKWLYENPDFWISIRNTLTILTISIVLITGLSILIAHMLEERNKVARLLRGIFLFPQVVSLVVVALLWKFLLHPDIGLINASLNGLGLSSLTATWLGQKSTALNSVSLAFIWWALGFYVMLFSAGLASIPTETKEAASLDGAQGLTRFWKVTWPMLWSVKRVALTYIVINVLNIFALVYLMTRGGDPDRATETALTYLYEVGFESSKFGHASAIAVANFVLAMSLAGLVFLVFRRNPEEGRA